MRTHRLLVVHHSILEVLHEPGCPFCRILKEFQADRLQNHAQEDLHYLCNFHTWGLAAVHDPPTAAQIFLKLVDGIPFANDVGCCDICSRMIEEEDLRIREFVSCLQRFEVSHWLRTDAVLCIPHALKLRKQVPIILTPRIDTIIGHYRQQLSQDLLQLRDEPGPDRSGWGALGRAAEFLVAQRGIRP